MLITDSMRNVLGIKDETYLEEFRPIFEKVFMDRLNRKFENCKSKYRADLTQQGECGSPPLHCESHDFNQVQFCCEAIGNAEHELIVPALTDIFAGLKSEDPSAADKKVTEAMKFLLNTAVPAVDPNTLRPRLWGKTGTHVGFFGKNNWPHEIATALILVSKFSDLDNLLYNAGLVDELGNRVECVGGLPQKPKKKKRKKMQTKLGEKDLQANYYKLCKFLRKLTTEDSFEHRMKIWDEICCGDRSGSPCDSIEQRTNIVPSAFQELDTLDEEVGGDSLAHEFILNTGLLSGWGSIPCLSDTDSGEGSTGTGSPPVTQPDVPVHQV